MLKKIITRRKIQYYIVSRFLLATTALAQIQQGPHSQDFHDIPENADQLNLSQSATESPIQTGAPSSQMSSKELGIARESSPTLFGIGVAFSRAGMDQLIVDTQTAKNYQKTPILLDAQLQIPYQKLGILSVGPDFVYYYTSGIENSTDKPSLVAALSYGGSIRYQARYFDLQPIVPIIGYSAQMWHYKLRDNRTGYFPVQGGVLGAYLNLNIFDPSSSNIFRAENGVRRTYLTGEVHFLKGQGIKNQMSGRAIFAGLRFEM